MGQWRQTSQATVCCPKIIQEEKDKAKASYKKSSQEMHSRFQEKLKALKNESYEMQENIEKLKLKAIQTVLQRKKDQQEKEQEDKEHEERLQAQRKYIQEQEKHLTETRQSIQKNQQKRDRQARKNDELLGQQMKKQHDELMQTLSESERKNKEKRDQENEVYENKMEIILQKVNTIGKKNEDKCKQLIQESIREEDKKMKKRHDELMQATHEHQRQALEKIEEQKEFFKNIIKAHQEEFSKSQDNSSQGIEAMIEERMKKRDNDPSLKKIAEDHKKYMDSLSNGDNPDDNNGSTEKIIDNKEDLHKRWHEAPAAMPVISTFGILSIVATYLLYHKKKKKASSTSVKKGA
ncbi:MAG: hypothetical protein AAF335_05130 [Bacteroidota bacterium]